MGKGRMATNQHGGKACKGKGGAARKGKGKGGREHQGAKEARGELAADAMRPITTKASVRASQTKSCASRVAERGILHKCVAANGKWTTRHASAVGKWAI